MVPAGKVLTAEMRKADLDSDGRISLSEFLRYYDTMSKLQSTHEREGRIRAYHQPQPIPSGAAGSPSASSHRLYLRYSSYNLTYQPYYGLYVLCDSGHRTLQ